MARSMLTVFVCGLLFGCGGMEGAGEGPVDNLTDVQAVPNGEGKGTVSELRVARSARTGATASFDPNGEVLTVVDTAKDGHSAVGQLKDNTANRVWTCWASGGNGSVKTCNYSIPEGHSVTVWACLGDADEGKGYTGCVNSDTTKSLK
jgi:hypothetical protein